MAGHAGMDELAAAVDMILVVGSRNSSNSNRLREIGQELGKPAYLIDDAGALQPAWFAGVASVGVTAGASAPELLVRELVAKLEERFAVIEREVETNRESIAFKLPRGLEAAA